MSESNIDESEETKVETQAPAPGVEPQNTKSETENRSELYFKGLDNKCDEEGAELAIAIVVDPKTPMQPLIYVRGEPYDAARLICAVARHLKGQLVNSEDLSV